jgi:magnesium transporter
MTPRPFHARLFDATDKDIDLTKEQVAGLEPSDTQLLWIDLASTGKECLQTIWSACELPMAALAFAEKGTTPNVETQGEYFWLRVVAASTEASHQLSGAVLTLVAGCNRLISIHDAELPFLEALRNRENAGCSIGRLSAESFVSSLLDAQLATYFDAVSEYEKAIESLENDILAGKGSATLVELRRLRRWASRLRRMLAPHRAVFGSLSRPDFRPSESKTTERHFAAIDTRFERAMDMVENARDLVLGSFELFSSQTALQTNASMKVLTFATVITGGLATLVGVLGMNFDAGFFKTQDLGFWIAIAGLASLTVAAMALGRWRRWF